MKKTHRRKDTGSLTQGITRSLIHEATEKATERKRRRGREGGKEGGRVEKIRHQLKEEQKCNGKKKETQTYKPDTKPEME